MGMHAYQEFVIFVPKHISEAVLFVILITQNNRILIPFYIHEKQVRDVTD